MAENILPEEKLFRIIQQEKKTPPRVKGKAPEKKRWAERLAVLVSRAKGIAGGVKIPLTWRIHDIQLFTINSILFVMVILLIIFTIYYAFARYPNIARMTTAAVRAQGRLPDTGKEGEELRPLSYYTEAARARDIFKPAPSEAPRSGDTVSASEKSFDGELKLQGIAWSDVPKALVFSEKESKLYVVKEGQAIGTTGIRVKSILRNKVMLNSGDKNFEL
ncbi:MAG: hypothetical protein WC522_04555 [Candidatus Omnitrophota bacterium]